VDILEDLSPSRTFPIRHRLFSTADILSLLGINLAIPERISDEALVEADYRTAEDQLLIMLVGCGSISFIGELNHRSKRGR
jgi:hypothetical protein